MYLKISSPEYTDTGEAAFLFSLAHLFQCYDPATGLVADRARWPVQDLAAVQSMGALALATAVASDLGYVDEPVATGVVTQIRNRLITLSGITYNGLLPHFVKNGDIAPGSEYSSVDTAIALLGCILACESLGLDASGLETMLNAVDWADLTDGYTTSISHGYREDETKLAGTWDVFGSEYFIVALAMAAATERIAPLDLHSQPPTWDGSGFNDEMAALLFPMNIRDHFGNNWSTYRPGAWEDQRDYFQLLDPDSLFGLSAAEAPEIWSFYCDCDDPGLSVCSCYEAFGIGGHNATPNDGTDWDIAGAGDFNNDCRLDILYRRISDGNIGVWLMDGTTESTWVLIGNHGTGWDIRGVGDFDKDGWADILYRHSNGNIGVWFMNGTTETSWTLIGNHGLDWDIKCVADYNLDGWVDILYRHSVTQNIGIWLMEGTTEKTWAPVGNHQGWDIR